MEWHHYQFIVHPILTNSKSPLPLFSWGPSIFNMRRSILLLILLVSIRPTESEDRGTCIADESGNCAADKETEMGASFCTGATWLYDTGGSAQAYRSGAPLSNVVCSADMAAKYRYKPASWPFSRQSMREGSAPRFDVTLKVHSCKLSMGDQCQCHLINRETTRSAASVVEIWQAKPNGRYSSLRSLNPDSNECRAQVPLSDTGVVKFTTVAPGSTGVMGGLGPGGWEWSPYGPPKIHILVRASGHAPLLVDLPIMINPKTLKPRTFFLGDLQGAAWMQGKPRENPMVIRSWKADIAKNEIALEIDVYLQQSHMDQPAFCPSYIYGVPSSFFLEPMSVCATSILDFFAL